MTLQSLSYVFDIQVSLGIIYELISPINLVACVSYFVYQKLARMTIFKTHQTFSSKKYLTAIPQKVEVSVQRAYHAHVFSHFTVIIPLNYRHPKMTTRAKAAAFIVVAHHHSHFFRLQDHNYCSCLISVH